MSTTIFGANGVRGIVNSDLTPEVVFKLGRAVGRTFPGEVALATDARDSAHAVRTALSAGIMASGSDVLDLGMLPTPALQYYVRTHPRVAGGVMITASHNSQDHNGLKLVLQGGVEATREDEQALESLFSREVPEGGRSKPGACRSESGAAEDYVDAIVSHVDAEAIRAAGLTICVDCANGAACATTPMLLKKLGVRAVSLECDPLGTPRRESDPTPENLSDLMSVVPRVHAAFGAAHDSDGGRTVFIDGDGGYVRGDSAGALIARGILATKKGKVVTSVSSSKVVEDVVEANGGLVKYTGVGSHSVIRKMIENAAVFGIEEDGGMVFPEMQMCRDGGMALAEMLETVAKGGPLKDQMSGFPAYYMVKLRVDCPDGLKGKVMNMFSRELEGSDLSIDITDGLKVSYDDGWVLIRPSTTEECLKIYADSSDAGAAESNAKSTVEMAKSFVEECKGISS